MKKLIEIRSPKKAGIFFIASSFAFILIIHYKAIINLFNGVNTVINPSLLLVGMTPAIIFLLTYVKIICYENCIEIIFPFRLFCRKYTFISKNIVSIELIEQVRGGGIKISYMVNNKIKKMSFSISTPNEKDMICIINKMQELDINAAYKNLSK